MKLRRKKIATGLYELVDEEGNSIARAEQQGSSPRYYHWEWELINGWHFDEPGVANRGVTKLLVLAVNEVARRAEEYRLVKA